MHQIVGVCTIFGGLEEINSFIRQSIRLNIRILNQNIRMISKGLEHG